MFCKKDFEGKVVVVINHFLQMSCGGEMDILVQ